MDKLKLTKAYQMVFDEERPEVKMVLSDLSEFCFLLKSSFGVDKNSTLDPLQLASYEGRREVILRILAHINTNFSQLSMNLKARKEKEFEDKIF